MKISLWGVRGSIPNSGPETNHYGGNTSCVSVSVGDWLLILDGGSGLQRLQMPTRANTNRIDILLTHLHLDHIQGLGFFKPLFDPTSDIHIWGPASSDHSLQSRLSRYLSPPLFPVNIRDLPCRLTLHEIENSVFEIGPFIIQSGYIIHPGPTVGFRIQCEGKVFTYIPDHEPALGPHGMISDLKWISGIDLAHHADLLLHDGQYTTEEYKHTVGWGHSSILNAVEFAEKAQVKRLLLSHHDPMHSDMNLTEIFKEFKQKNEFAFPYELAVEGTTIDL
jgi:phosphoribosyl 1,2-cyclic phosphodiesterase